MFYSIWTHIRLKTVISVRFINSSSKFFSNITQFLELSSLVQPYLLETMPFRINIALLGIHKAFLINHQVMVPFLSLPDVQVNCIKYAIVSQLQNPSPGFEDVINTHFYLKRERLIQVSIKHTQGDIVYFVWMPFSI